VLPRMASIASVYMELEVSGRSAIELLRQHTSLANSKGAGRIGWEVSTSSREIWDQIRYSM
jgi:hypothetical protein